MPTKLQLLNLSIKAVPFMKYALAAVGVAIAVSLIKSYNKGEIPILEILVVVGLMILLFTLSSVYKSKTNHPKVAGIILIYSVIILTICSAILLLTSAFIDFPKPISAYKLNPHVEVQHKDSTQTKAKVEQHNVTGDNINADKVIIYK